jgi:ABC-type branched-subunit amino acid transport system substrate-binding protein
MRRCRRERTLGAVACLVLGLAACSSSSGGGGDQGGSSSDSGKPIKLMIMGQLQAPTFAFPDMEVGAKAAAAQINADGGVRGRKIEMTACNDGGSASKAAACARQAVAGGFTALVGGVSANYDSVFPILEPASIPVIGASPLGSAAQTSPMSFPVDSFPAQFVAEGISLVKYKNCTKVAILYIDSPTVKIGVREVADGVRSAGGKVTKTTVMPETTRNFPAVISALLDSGAGCISTLISPATLVKVVAALRASSKPNAPIGAVMGGVTPPVITSLGKAADGIIVTNNAFTAESEVWRPVRDAMTKASPGVKIENFGVLAWSAVYTFADMAQGMSGDITAKSVVAFANKQATISSTGYPSTVDWASPGPITSAPRLFNSQALLYEIKNGALTLTSETPVNTFPALTEEK